MELFDEIDGFMMEPTKSSFDQFNQVSIGEVVSTCEKRDPRSLGKACFTYVDIASVSNKTFSIVSPKIIQGKDAPSRARKVIRSGDVIFSTTRPYLKSIARVTEELDNQICSTGFCVLRPSARILAEWLFFCAVSDDVLMQIKPLMRGATYPAVSDKDILSAIIPLPSLTEQREIISKMTDIMDRVVEIEKLRLQVVSEESGLRDAILRRAFAGEL